MAKRNGGPRKTSVKTSVPRRALVTQPHGGALGVGGTGAGGRPVEVLRRKCRAEIETRKGIEFVAGVMDGSETEDVVATSGKGKDAVTEVVPVRPKIRDRLYAAELLLDRGYGKPPQTLEVEPSAGGLAHVSDEEMLRVLYARAERLKVMRARAATLRAHGVNLDALSA